MSDSRFDYIVIGAGAAGCVVAARLSERPDMRVLLIEAGGKDTPFPFHVPGLGFLASSRKSQNWWFETEPSSELDGRSQIWLQGKLLGGSSSINGMIYNRGHSLEYDHWRQLGCEGWGFEDVLPFFRKAEANERGADRWHGGSGAMPVRRSRSVLPIYDQFLKACADDGLPTLSDLNNDTVDGFGYYDVNIHGGKRMSAAQAYLVPARNRPNLTVLSNTLARRILFDGNRATGVEISENGVVRRVHARREIVVSGGSIKSPQLLMLSGIGPADALRSAGIDVVAASPNVGRNLQNHPSYRMQYLCSGRSTAFNYLTPLGMVSSGASYLLSRGGGLGESIFGVGGFFRSRPELEAPDLQVVMCGALITKPTTNDPSLWQMLPKRQGFALVIYQGTPYSRGHVTLRNANPDDAPIITSGYLTDPRDLDVLMAGIRRMRKVCTGPHRPQAIVEELSPGPSVVSDVDLERDIRANISTSYHQSGTCAMGKQETSVVDARLRVRGVTGLRVADASIMPVMLNAALHGPVLMIGEKAASMILEDARQMPDLEAA